MKKLFEILSNIDINIISLEYYKFIKFNVGIYKLVIVHTISINIAQFNIAINQNETGILYNNTNNIFISIKSLIENEKLRKYSGKIGYKVYKMHQKEFKYLIILIQSLINLECFLFLLYSILIEYMQI